MQILTFVPSYYKTYKKYLVFAFGHLYIYKPCG